MLQVRCPDGGYCPDNYRCCHGIPVGTFACCAYGRFATCCPDSKTCCPPGYQCIVSIKRCVGLTDSSVLRVQAILLVNSTDERCRDGTEGMDPKVSKIMPSLQVETASKINGFIGTSGNVFSPDEKYQCPDGTSICELSSGIHGCCHLVRGYVNYWQENSCFLGFGKLSFHYQSLNQLFSYVYFLKKNLNTHIDSCTDACITPICCLLLLLLLFVVVVVY